MTNTYGSLKASTNNQWKVIIDFTNGGTRKGISAQEVLDALDSLIEIELEE